MFPLRFSAPPEKIVGFSTAHLQDVSFTGELHTTPSVPAHRAEGLG